MGLFHRNTAPAFQMVRNRFRKTWFFPEKSRFSLCRALRLNQSAVPLAAGAQLGDLRAGHLLGADVIRLANAIQWHLAGFENDPVARLLSSTPAFVSTTATTASETTSCAMPTTTQLATFSVSVQMCFSTSPGKIW